MTPSPAPAKRSSASPGYSLVEVMVCVVIIGTMFAAAVHTLGASRLGERQTIDHARAHTLAHALMDEIMQQAYQDPGPTPVFGPEPGEDDGTRQHFNDVDDYHDWSASPPTSRDGTPLPGLDGWTRSVHVQWVALDDASTAMNHDTALKRITVTVRRGEATLATLVGLRSAALDKERPSGAIAP